MADESKRISLTVDRSGQPRTFDTAKELHDWMRSETEKWRWLPDVRNRFAGVKPIISTQFLPLNQEVSKLDAVVADADSYLQQAYNSAVNISSRVSDHNLLTSEDPAGRFVLELAAQKRLAVAAFALGYLTKTSVTATEAQDETFEGKFLAAAFLFGIKGSAESERAALEALSSEYRSAIESQRADVAAGATRRDQLEAALVSELKEAKESFVAAEDKRQKAAENAEVAREEGFQQLRRAFNEFMALKAPVQYWTDSAKWHRRAAAAFSIVALVWGTVVGWKVYSLAMELIVANPKGWEKPPVLEIGALLLLVTLAIWLLRVLVRMTLSNLHQGADAESRATMTEAYLALIEGGKALPEKDRILVLTTLFRPMSTGLIKDDAMPPSITELLSRIVGGKGAPS